MLSDEQGPIAKSIVECLLDGQECSLTGLAGTGKTTVTKSVYNELTKRGVGVCVMAPAAKAAMVLTKKGVPATTIHRIIYDFKGKFETDKGDIELIFNRKSGKIRKVVFIIDEGSMVTAKQARDIRNHDLPSLWVGDPGQLPPVKSPPTDVLTCGVRHHLKEIHRQAKDSPIIQYAHGLRSGKPLTWKYPGINYVKVNGGGAHKIVETMRDRSIDRIVTKTNEQRCAINKAWREVHGKQGIVDVGDTLICLANNRRLGIINGEMFEVLAVEASNEEETKVRVKSEVGWTASLWVKNEQFGKPNKLDLEYDEDVAIMDYAAAITCHKMQGSSAPHVGIIDKGYCGDACSWNYTSATRAEENITIFW